jgi:hypothetical protein
VLASRYATGQFSPLGRLSLNNGKFRKLVGSDAKVESMEKEVERLATYALACAVKTFC